MRVAKVESVGAKLLYSGCWRYKAVALVEERLVPGFYPLLRLAAHLFQLDGEFVFFGYLVCAGRVALYPVTHEAQAFVFDLFRSKEAALRGGIATNHAHEQGTEDVQIASDACQQACGAFVFLEIPPRSYVDRSVAWRRGDSEVEVLSPHFQDRLELTGRDFFVS